MNTIGRKSTFAGLPCVLVSLSFFALPAQAQFVPNRYYYPDMGVMGSVTSAYQSAAQMQSYNANRQMQMTSSMARSQAWQNVNRSMQAEAASRPSSVPDSAQAARDWMFQNSQPTRVARRPMTLPRTDLAAVSIQQEVAKEPVRRTVPKEIMLWPTLLKQQSFDADRADVEAPFRRAYADKTPLTIDDYQQIIRTVEKMKDAVKGMESQLVDTEYTSVQKYLDDLITDAQKRIKERE